MRTYPTSEDDQKDLTELNAASWMVETLKLNPSYVFWGPYEDSMGGKDTGWTAPVFHDGWPAMAGWELDDLNECVNFYFEIERSSVKCEICEAAGLNPATLHISKTFYDFDHTGERWCENITQDESDMLWEAGRLRIDFKEKPTAMEVNIYQRRALGHDAINRWLLVKHRANRLGVYGKCAICEGRGHLYTEDAAHLNLILWMIHPRKGASRGVEVKNIQEHDLSSIVVWLKEAAQRNVQRFAAVVNL